MADNVVVKGRYIVTFKPHVTRDIVDAHIASVQKFFASRTTLGALQQLSSLIHRYEIGDFAGYSRGFDEEMLAEIHTETTSLALAIGPTLDCEHRI
ncbi:hypothetical protein MFIFM68171_10182 [Madurella fahalii]|uniref:Inhibitor I9 domain-containing protein n=1 Tax=Madurella fahalii TaxID=1157608 RepID=A0ABQ0GQG8_9PEZI